MCKLRLWYRGQFIGPRLICNTIPQIRRKGESVVVQMIIHNYMCIIICIYLIMCLYFINYIIIALQHDFTLTSRYQIPKGKADEIHIKEPRVLLGGLL